MNARGLGSELKDSIPVTELSASGPFESHDLLQKENTQRFVSYSALHPFSGFPSTSSQWRHGDWRTQPMHKEMSC
ncbi:hypothetical protein H8959_008814 [Pygathrix nigripes]